MASQPAQSVKPDSKYQARKLDAEGEKEANRAPWALEQPEAIPESKSVGKPLKPKPTPKIPAQAAWAPEPEKRGEMSIQAVSAARLPESTRSSDPTEHTRIKHLTTYKYGRHPEYQKARVGGYKRNCKYLWNFNT